MWIKNECNGYRYLGDSYRNYLYRDTLFPDLIELVVDVGTCSETMGRNWHAGVSCAIEKMNRNFLLEQS